MNMMEELRGEVSSILSDPDIRSGSVFRLKRRLPVAEVEEDWIDTPAQYQVYDLDAFASTKSSGFAGDSVFDRETAVTVSPLAHMIQSGPDVVDAKVIIEVLPSDVISVDGRDRSIGKIKRIPEAGTVVAWLVELAD